MNSAAATIFKETKCQTLYRLLRANELNDDTAELIDLKDLNKFDRWGNAAIHLAAISNSIESAEWLLRNGVDINARSRSGVTALFNAIDYVADNGNADMMRFLLKAGSDVNAYCDEYNICGATPLETCLLLMENSHTPFTLELLIFGAEIGKDAIEIDELGLLKHVNDRLNLIRDGKPIEESLMGNEERKFMWNLAFFLTIKHGGATAFKVYYLIRSFITFHGIFMARGYELGKDSLWCVKRDTNDGHISGGPRHIFGVVTVVI